MPIRLLLAVSAFLCSLGSLAEQAKSYPFSIESEKQGGGHRIVARNGGPASVSVMVSVVDSIRIASDSTFPLFAVVPPGDGAFELARIRPAAAGAGYSFRTHSTWTLGDFTATHSADAAYRLPYPDGMAFRIGQAPGGPITTHATADSRHAVDIGMTEGAPVVAARDGVVIYTEADQRYGGQSPDMMAKANEVRIQHGDGTIAAYAHLAHGGVLVKRGERVAAGTRIGLAGSTGYSSGPHLHFVVQTVARTGDGFAVVSVPFRFHVGNPPAIFAPRSGMLARADYASPGRVPGAEAVAQAARTRREAPAAAQAPSGSPRRAVGIEALAPTSSLLQRIPLWKWMIGISAIALLFLLLLLVRIR